MNEGETHLYITKKDGKSIRVVVNIPQGVLNDSQFPFREGEPLIIGIDGETLVIRKTEMKKE